MQWSQNYMYWACNKHPSLQRYWSQFSSNGKNSEIKIKWIYYSLLSYESVNMQLTTFEMYKCPYISQYNVQAIVEILNLNPAFMVVLTSSKPTQKPPWDPVFYN